MNGEDDRLKQLLLRLDQMIEKQTSFSKEIQAMKDEIYRIQYAEKISEEFPKETAAELKEKVPEPISPQEVPVVEREQAIVQESVEVNLAPKRRVQVQKKPSKRKKPTLNVKSDLEKFIGENLISKIGILITVIGVGIGAKYSIENELISPLTRIILGYLWGLGLLGAGIKLKSKYINFSAVLVSGAMAIMYFMSYAAYDFYGLIPQTVTFVLMLIFTAFTVVTALHYGRQLIALIGLVGAYGLPFLLSTDSGNVLFLFSYMTIVNIGILYISFKKSWKTLYYTAFGLSWMIYLVWYGRSYEESLHFAIAFVFLILFFIVFNTIILAYKLLKTDQLSIVDILLLLLNAIAFYAVGYNLLDVNPDTRWMLGLFTLANAVLHLFSARIIYKRKLVDPNLFYLVMGIVITFLTISFPVQLDGNWVTLMWVLEAAVLFWIGRTKKIAIYEGLSYPLMALAVLSQAQDWVKLIENSASNQLLSIHFFSGLLFVAAFAFINKIHFDKNHDSSLKKLAFEELLGYALPTILIGGLYIVFRLEIVLYFQDLHNMSMQELSNVSDRTFKIFDPDVYLFKKVCLTLYSLFFLSVLSLVNIKKIKNLSLSWANIGMNVFGLLIFMLIGLYNLGLLRDSYLGTGHLTDSYEVAHLLGDELAGVFDIGIWNILIRYVAYVFVGMLLWTCYLYSRQEALQTRLKIPFEYLMYVSILWITSSELIHCLDMLHSKGTYKIGLSIYWGLYALYMIARGIQKRKKYIRLMGMVVFGITLLKLFFYDIAHLNTISKTIVFVSLGLLLLIISFLYNKYKDNITDEESEV